MTQQQRAAMQQALDALIAIGRQCISCSTERIEAQEALRKALEAPEQPDHIEDVRDMVKEEPARTLTAPASDEDVLEYCDTHPGSSFFDAVVALEGFAAGRAAGVDPAVVLEGWQLVPEEPTPEMILALQAALERIDSDTAIYRTMLEAAPKPVVVEWAADGKRYMESLRRTLPMIEGFAAADIASNESAQMLELANRIAESACPDDDSRLEVAYAIARHLKLGWPSAQPAVAEPVKWGSPKTVGNFIRQLQTIDADSPIHGAMFTEIDGKKTALIKGLTLSRERVAGRFIKQGDESVPYSHVVWTSDDERIAPPVSVMKGWISVDERLPGPGVVVLAFFRNVYGKKRTVRAHYAPKHTIEASEDWDEGSTDDTEDGCFEPEGWWEDPVIGERLEFIGVSDGEVTHWMPLPPPPTATKGAAHENRN